MYGRFLLLANQYEFLYNFKKGIRAVLYAGMNIFFRSLSSEEQGAFENMRFIRYIIGLVYRDMQHFALGRGNRLSIVHKNSCNKVKEGLDCVMPKESKECNREFLLLLGN